MALKPGAAIWVPPSAASKVAATPDEGERLSGVVLDVVNNRHKVDARLDGSIQDGTIEATTKGAPMLTLQVLDPDLELLNSSLFTRRIDTFIDKIPFRLVEVSRQDDAMIELQFEHRLVSWLRQHTVAKKTSRNTKTRAEFAYSLVLEVKKGPVSFISPDVHKKQPRKTAKPLDKETKDERRSPGFADNATKLKIANAPATRSQLKEVDKALGVAAAKNASPLATKAMVCAGIGESGFKAIMNLAGSPYGGVFQGKAKERGGPWDIHDTEGMAESFLEGGKGFQGGGAIALARRRPPMSPGAIALMVEGSTSNFASAAAGQAHYGKWANEAEDLIGAWQGEELSSGGSAQSYYQKFEFTRGNVHPGDAKEDSWMALQRLADEVRWRCFIAGSRVLYFVSDEQLMRSRPLYVIDPQTEGVRSLTFDMEVGKRTVIYKGRRESKPSEATLKVRLGRWAAPPGSIVELAGYGIADGRWIVDSMTRGVYDSDGEVQLRQPQKALPEPAPEVATKTSGGRDGGDGASGGTGEPGVRPGNTYVGSPIPGQQWHSSTHQTGNLPGYPAFDYMAPPGTSVVAPESGTIRKLSGKDPSLGGAPGQALGYSIYVHAPPRDYFMTHLDKVTVKVGQKVAQGEQIAEVANGPASWSSPHCHQGINGPVPPRERARSPTNTQADNT